MSKALVVLSGGQDSVTCLGLAKVKYDEVHAIIFQYGQKHSVEVICAVSVCEKYKVPYKVMEIPAFRQMNDSALIAGNEQDVNDQHSHKTNLPATFVPARNATFLTLAHGYAQCINANVIVTGVCDTDYSGYPDCRHGFILSLQHTLNCGYQTNIIIDTPLMNLNKAQTFELAEELGILADVIHMSHTCYNGERKVLNEWGYGCGECPACKLRKAGYEKFIENKEFNLGCGKSEGDDSEEHC